MPDALIVGAGIGGLSAGIALRQIGWNVRIFERASSPRELGFGVALAPNAMAALAELGLADIVLGRGFEPRRAEFRRTDGRVVKRVELAPETLHGPMVIALRPALHGALLDSVGMDTITLQSDVTGFRPTGHRIVLQTAAGDVAEGDMLIGADGFYSVVRRQLHPDEPPPRPARIVAVRGAVHDVLDHLRGLSAVGYLGPGVESVLIRASDTGMYWYLSVAEQLLPHGMREPRAIVAHMAPRFDQTFRTVTSATTELRADELADRDPISFWGKGTVTLLGDAAHPVLPHTGQGAAQALVDSITLGRTLKTDTNIERALRSYEQARQPKTAALLQQGRRTARIMRMTNPVGCWVREMIIRAIPVKPLVKFYARINRRAGTSG